MYGMVCKSLALAIGFGIFIDVISVNGQCIPPHSRVRSEAPTTSKVQSTARGNLIYSIFPGMHFI